MEDPFRHAIGQNSRSSNIYSTIRSMVPEMSGWVCNMQLFLTKIDEFPYFLYRDITKLNSEWQAWFQNAYQQDAAHQFGAYGTAGANAAVYTAALLHILDQLRNDFYNKDAAEVIHPDIMSVISSLLHYEKGLFSGTSYEAARGQIIPDLLKFSADTADRQTLRDVLLDYMIGLDSIRANYYQLRNLIRLLMRGARRNLQNNDASRFYFGFYAVSATGYSKIVTLAKELGLFHKPVSYQPEFVRESHRMLQCTTLEFCNAAQLTQNSGGLPCHAGCPDLIFDALPETHDPFRPSALDAYRSSGEPLSLLRICEEEVFAERPVFACESAAGLQKDLARVRAWENGAEPEQKQFAQMLPLLEIYRAIGTEPGAQPDSP